MSSKTLIVGNFPSCALLTRQRALMTVKTRQVSYCDSWRVLRSTTGFGWYNNATTMTSLYSGLTAWTEYYINSSDFSALANSNFTYHLPNITLFADFSAEEGSSAQYGQAIFNAWTCPAYKPTMHPQGQSVCS